ncbi:MAG: hemolysin family protein [Xanthobacteraceae bacterium]
MSNAVPDPDAAPDDDRETQAHAPAAETARAPQENWLARAVRTLIGWRSGSTRSDLESLLETPPSAESGFSAAERTMLRNILDLRERRVADVMVQRADIIAASEDIPLGDLMKLFESAGVSRLVVYRETLDDPEGMVHIRDLLAYITSRSQVDPDANTRRKRPLPANLDLRSINLAMPLTDAGIIRKLLYVPPSKPALDLLAQMQTTHIHLALVVDEYGGTDGLVSIEDIVEQIVGEIEDEHDIDVPPAIIRQPDNSFIADARAPIEDAVAAIGPEFEPGEMANTVDTLGGYLVAQVGRLPARGEVISGPGRFEVEVLDADPSRLKLLRISQRKDRPPSQRARPQRRRPAAQDSTQDSSTQDQPAQGPSTQDPSLQNPSPPDRTSEP